MVRDPRRSDGYFHKAGSLLFFFIAVLTILSGAALELLQQLSPLQIEGSIIFLLLVALLILIAFWLRGILT